MKTATENKSFDEIWDEMRISFDWSAVYYFMKLTNWRWRDSNGTPSYVDLQDTAKHLLDIAYDDMQKIGHGFAATGGFSVSCGRTLAEITFTHEVSYLSLNTTK